MRLSLVGSSGSLAPDILIALAVAVGVDHQRRPPLRGDAVLGFAEFLGVEPADDARPFRPWTARAHPQGVVGIVPEIKMMRREAGVDQVPIGRLRDRSATVRAPHWPADRPWRREGSSPACSSRDWRRSQFGGEPDLPCSSIITLWMGRVAVPDRVIAPIGRGCRAARLPNPPSSGRGRGSLIVEATFLTGSSVGIKSVLSSGEP